MFVLERILPFFLIVGLGAALARTRALDAAAATGLSRYVYWVGFPALLIYSLSHSPPPDAAALRGLAGYAVGAAVPLIAAVIVGRLRGWPQPVRAGAAMAATSGNTAFLGLPLILLLMGEKMRGVAVAMIAVDWVLIAPLAMAGLHRAAKGGSPLRGLIGGLLNPIVAAAGIGALLMMLRAPWPPLLETAGAALAATGSPVGLIALGAVIGLEAHRPARDEIAPVLVAAVLKLIATPLAVYLGVRASGAPADFTAAAVLMAACPTAVSVFAQARTFSVFARGAATAVALTTLVSAATLGLLAMMLQVR